MQKGYCWLLIFLLATAVLAEETSTPPVPQSLAPDLTLTEDRLFGTFTFWRQTAEGYECGYIDFNLDHTWTMVIHLDVDRDRYPDRIAVTKGQYAVGRKPDGEFGFWLEGDQPERLFLADLSIIGGRVHSFSALERAFTRREGDMAYFVLENDTAELAGQLRIVSEPVGAVVFINGQQVQGNTPLIVEKLRAGIPLRIRVELPAHRAPEQNITLSANENREIQFTLRHGSSGVRITSLPRVQVRLDGEWVGVTPLTLDDLPAGPHQLELSNTSLELSVHEPIDLVEGETLRRHYQFTGRLRIDVGRPCRLYRRDKLAGTTPFDARVPVGRHVLVLEDASGERRQLVVDVPLDGEVRVEKPFESLPEVD